jgi:hypothetical protein
MTDRHILIEQWKSRPAWRHLSTDDRRTFADRIAQASTGTRPDGIRVIAWGYTDRAAPFSIELDFWAVWDVDSADAARVFMEGIEASGWYNYFEQVNTVGRCGSVVEILDALVKEPFPTEAFKPQSED